MLQPEDGATIEGETALQLFARVNRAKDTLGPLGVPVLDDALPRAGLAPGATVELVGPPGSCKTQLLLDIACQCIMPQQWNGIQIGGKHVSAVLVDLDCRFDVMRLAIMLEERLRHCTATVIGAKLVVEDSERFVRECLNRLFHVRCNNNLNFLATLQSLDTFLQSVRAPPVRVMIIDNIASFFWGERAEAQGNFKQQYFFPTKICTVIKNLARDHRLVVFASRALLFPSGYSGGKGDDRASATAQDPTCKEWQSMVTHRFTLAATSKQETRGYLRNSAGRQMAADGYTFTARATYPQERADAVSFGVNTAGTCAL